jgi:hypothetical protein
VFDVLGKCFSEKPLRDLLMEAVRYGDSPEVKARLNQVVDKALDRERLRELIEERALAHESMDTTKVQQIREDMERIETRKLQPHFISAFFREAFAHLGGTYKEREAKRYEITHVPSLIRQRDRVIGTGDTVLTRYERVTFEKTLITVDGKPPASFLCPGHPLLDATTDIILERHRDLLKRGTVLVDLENKSETVRALFFLDHMIQDGRTDAQGNRRMISRQMQFVEIDRDGSVCDAGYAPYLDYRPVTDEERTLLENVLDQPWLRADLESQVVGYAAEHIVPRHLEQVKTRKEQLVQKAMAAVKDRLTKEINYWDHRANELKAQQEAGRQPRMNWQNARARADELQGRLQKRLAELEQERRISPQSPNVIGGALVVPLAMIGRLTHGTMDERPDEVNRKRIERLAVEAVLSMERKLGREAKEMPHENPGYDIESRDPVKKRLLFIEVKGKAPTATTVTVSKTQILTALNKPKDFILAIVQVDGNVAGVPHYIHRPFKREPDFAATSVNYDLSELVADSQDPS